MQCQLVPHHTQNCESMYALWNVFYDVSERYATTVTKVESNVPPISGISISFFCNVTISSRDDLEADFNYIWFRDDVQLLGEDKYSGIGSDHMNITVSTTAWHLLTAQIY